MLIIGRKAQQTILIGPDITITVISTGSQYTRLGVDAPLDMSIYRGEVARAIVAGVPLHAIEQRLDYEENARRLSVRLGDRSSSRMIPDEDDQISRPRADAMQKQLRSMEVELDCLRSERDSLAKTVAELQEAMASR